MRLLPVALLHDLQEESIRIGRKPAIDHERAFFAADGDHITARALKKL